MNGTDRKILIVEDEDTMRVPLIEALGAEGYRTLSASDGEQGLELANRERPDLILLDIDLPGMDGMELMKKVRASGEHGKQVKIILITNLPADDDIMQGIAEDEPAYFLSKSEWNIPAVVQRVQEALGTAKSAN